MPGGRPLREQGPGGAGWDRPARRAPGAAGSGKGGRENTGPSGSLYRWEVAENSSSHQAEPGKHPYKSCGKSGRDRFHVAAQQAGRWGQ